ncbi:hybrid sensor histidine kinase/response regulator [Phenylobacterium deserti]|uniref:histidine kinase n=1 Tax=Phenylobacterium deserti TaxID=1914756 RepID=A0A328AA46_9CAUL|nr:PAS domain-containing protein [Phenylobacterium deserti]RAK51419.1 hybrid sensor histidine kinase/response regulator [Phenylobacterium deserti]
MLPLRLIARRSPPLGSAVAVSLGSLAVAVLVRMILLGPEHGFGPSVTFLPAFIVATLYGGGRWGLASLLFALLLNFLSPSRLVDGRDAMAMTVMFALSAIIAIWVTSAFRNALVRLEEARVDQESTQAELAATEQRLTLAQDVGGVGLWDWDFASNVRRWSTVVYRNFGIPPGDPPGLDTLLAAIHPDDRESFYRAQENARTQGHLEPVEYRVVHPDGSTRWLLTRGEVLRDGAGKPVRALGVNIDVTERRLAFEQMLQSEARFRVLADSAPILMWVSRTDGRREFANRAYVDFLRVDYEAAIAFDWRTVLHPDDLDRVLREQLAGETSRKPFTLEARYRRWDGQFRWVRSVSQPRYSPTGEFEGFIGVGFDVSDAKRAEADLLRINDLLAERVEAALSERDQAEAALRRAQKLEAVGQLTGGVAHDFNNLLTVIIGALDLIQRNPGDSARAERMIEAALSAARRGERLTQQLLAFSRRQALRPEFVRIDELLAESEPLLRRAVGEAVSFVVEPAAPGAAAHVDPSQFEAAIMNLVVNARDATPAGGTIRLESVRCAIRQGELEDVAGGDYVCVLVHDTGQGMDADTVGRVFEPFFTTKEPGRGTGLGLSQVYGFARQSGGGVMIDSAPGRGTTVRIYLPLAQADVAAPDAAAALEAPARSAPRLQVLLVEDDGAVGDMVEAMLLDLGHAVLRADGPAAALQILSEPARRIDLLLTDLIMPGDRTGVDLAHAAVQLRPGLPVILSSGYTGEALNPAVDAPWPLLRKPYAAAELARLIGEVTPRTR